MLDLYPFTLETIRLTSPSIIAIERRDGDLARQLRRAAASVALNLAEGCYSQGENRRARYFNAAWVGSRGAVVSGGR
jgi:four helix bundle protein